MAVKWPCLLKETEQTEKGDTAWFRLCEILENANNPENVSQLSRNWADASSSQWKGLKHVRGTFWGEKLFMILSVMLASRLYIIGKTYHIYTCAVYLVLTAPQLSCRRNGANIWAPPERPRAQATRSWPPCQWPFPHAHALATAWDTAFFPLLGRCRVPTEGGSPTTPWPLRDHRHLPGPGGGLRPALALHSWQGSFCGARGGATWASPQGPGVTPPSHGALRCCRWHSAAGSQPFLCSTHPSGTPTMKCDVRRSLRYPTVQGRLRRWLPRRRFLGWLKPLPLSRADTNRPTKQGNLA